MSSSVMSSNQENNRMLMTLSTPDSRSVSPLTPSPSREIRGITLFRAISRKLTRRSSRSDAAFSEDLDSRSSSTDSCSSTDRCSRTKRSENNSSSAESGFRSVSPHHLSSSSSDLGSDTPTKHRHHHSTSAESIRRVFQSLSINHRSHSCTNTKDIKRKTSKKAAPKKILRSPTTYTYVKGLSGLPTQRIPKSLPKVYTNSGCNCSMQYLSGLRR